MDNIFTVISVVALLFVPAAPINLPVVSVRTFSGVKTGFGDRSLAYDGKVGSSEAECYRPEDDFRGWAKFEIPRSQVNKVAMVPVESSHNSEVLVQVCTNITEGCVNCAVFVDRGDYNWTESLCPEGTVGDTVVFKKAQRTDKWMSLCEVNITGNPLEHLRGVIKANGSEPISSDYPLSQATKGRVNKDLSTCYRSEATSNAWAEFKIPATQVSRVFLAAAQNYYTNNYLLTVCNGPTNCTECGYFPRSIRFYGTSLPCPTAAQGDVVRITARDNYRLEICTIHIFGNELVNPNVTVRRGYN